MAAMYWSEHGDRAQLVSWAACVGVQKTTLDALGRWRAGSSSQYIRTRLATDAQNAVAKAIKEYEGNDDVSGEEVVFDGLAAHLKAKGVDEDSVRAQVGRARGEGSRRARGGVRGGAGEAAQGEGSLRGVDVNEDKCSLPSPGWRMLAPAWGDLLQVRGLGTHRRRLRVEPRTQAVLAELFHGHRGSSARKGGERI